MPSIAICPNADVPVDLLKSMQGFKDELEGIEFLVKQYLAKTTGRLDASARLTQLNVALAKGKQETVDEYFGD